MILDILYNKNIFVKNIDFNLFKDFIPDLEQVAFGQILNIVDYLKKPLTEILKEQEVLEKYKSLQKVINYGKIFINKMEPTEIQIQDILLVINEGNFIQEDMQIDSTIDNNHYYQDFNF